jgi:DNA-directed RNA polymerase specialized sigma24 family protein
MVGLVRTFLGRMFSKPPLAAISALAPPLGLGGERVERREPDALTEQELSARALAGCRHSWDALIARHDRTVVLALLARGVRLAHAREAAHEAWVRLLMRQRAGGLERLELPGLAIKQAWFCALDGARRRADEGRAPVCSEAALDEGGDLEERLWGRQRLELAREALDRCSPTARRAFLLSQGSPPRSCPEIASELGLSVQRVRQILTEVRATLRRALEAANG